MLVPESRPSSWPLALFFCPCIVLGARVRSSFLLFPCRGGWLFCFFPPTFPTVERDRPFFFPFLKVSPDLSVRGSRLPPDFAFSPFQPSWNVFPRSLPTRVYRSSLIVCLSAGEWLRSSFCSVISVVHGAFFFSNYNESVAFTSFFSFSENMAPLFCPPLFRKFTFFFSQPHDGGPYSSSEEGLFFPRSLVRICREGFISLWG